MGRHATSLRVDDTVIWRNHTMMTYRLLLGFLLLAVGASAVSPAQATTSLGSAAGVACGNGPHVVAADLDSSTITPDDPNSGTASCSALCNRWVAFCRGMVASKAACWNSARAKYSALKNAECAVLADPAAEESCKADVKAERDALKITIDDSVELGRSTCATTGLSQCLLNCN
jgi:hypothetical protein